MRNITSLWVGSLAMLGSFGAPPPGEVGPPARAAEVSLMACSEAGEHWRGVTVVRRGGRSLELTEDVTLDAAGRLRHAETRSREAGARPGARPEVRAFYDRATSSVVVASGGVTTLHLVDGTGPWVYGAVATSAGAVPTRLAAWVAYRAARGSSAVRLVDAGRGTSALVPVDQVLVDTELGPVAVLGDEAIVVGGIDASE